MENGDAAPKATKVEEIEGLRLKTLELERRNLDLRQAMEMRECVGKLEAYYKELSAKYDLGPNDEINCDTLAIERK